MFAVVKPRAANQATAVRLRYLKAASNSLASTAVSSNNPIDSSDGQEPANQLSKPELRRRQEEDDLRRSNWQRMQRFFDYHQHRNPPRHSNNENAHYRKHLHGMHLLLSNPAPTIRQILTPLNPSSLMRLMDLYKQLTKARLSTLVVLTTMAGYAMAPLTCSASPLSLMATAIGTGLCVSSANSINQWIEVHYDRMMSRTRSRVLARNCMTPFHAATFGCLTGVAGTALLASAVNPLTAALGASNIILYTAAYTYLKRKSIINTWIGSIVGGIPPIMGWTAVTGSIDTGALLLGALLYAWQFPHFNSLSWNIRHDYQRAGYKMMAITDPSLNSRVSLRYSLALFPICWALTAVEVTSPCFLLTSMAPNAWMSYYAYQFYRHSKSDEYAKKLFFSSLFHLPAVIVLMLIHKRWPMKQQSKERMEDIVHKPFGVHADDDPLYK